MVNSLYLAVATCHNLRYVAGFSYVGGADSYQKSAWSLGDKYIKEYNDWFLEQQTQFLLGRYQKVFIGLFFITLKAYSIEADTLCILVI